MSNYMDFWCIDKRNRMHNIIMYVLIFAILFVFSNLMIYLYINGTYKFLGSFLNEEDASIAYQNKLKSIA